MVLAAKCGELRMYGELSVRRRFPHQAIRFTMRGQCTANCQFAVAFLTRLSDSRCAASVRRTVSLPSLSSPGYPIHDARPVYDGLLVRRRSPHPEIGAPLTLLDCT